MLQTSVERTKEPRFRHDLSVAWSPMTMTLVFLTDSS